MEPAILTLVVILLCLLAPLAALSRNGRQAEASAQQTPKPWPLSALPFAIGAAAAGAVAVGVLALYRLP